MPRTWTCPATIASGGTTSSVVRVHPASGIALQMPATFTGTAVAVHGCATATGTFAAIEDRDGNAVSLAAAAGDRASLTGEELDAVIQWPYIKLVSNGAEGAAREIGVVLSL